MIGTPDYPLGIFPGVINGLEVAYTPAPAVCVIDAAIQNGGLYSPRLLGPTPANRVGVAFTATAPLAAAAPPVAIPGFLGWLN